ncbi:MAG: DUF3943 domain-containing protein, partial [Bacteroidetes bacterium]|nr:DUF3943 domain-containing protein [Bacteroidota bacterium]
FAYSQAILWPSSIAGHIGLYILKDDFDWSRAVTWSMYKQSFSMLPRLDKDHWSWNYEVHPMMGSFSYLAYRNRGAAIWESFTGSALNSVIYEYIIAGGTQPPSWNDMVITPISGSLVGEGLFQMKKYFLRDNYLTIFEKILISVSDPFEVLYFGFNFNKMIHYHGLAQTRFR